MTARDNRVTARASRHATATTEPDHSSGELRGMFGALERLGYDLDRLLTAAGIRRADVEDPTVNIPASVCVTLLTLAHQERRLKNLPSRLALENPIAVNPLLATPRRPSWPIRRSIAEVTYLLGYSEPTAFHRAFRRWHRVTPQEFRQQRRDA